jgi:hypothetical protein
VLYCVVFMDSLAFTLVVDTCVLQPPISTSGETSSASHVFLKGPVVRAYWCTVRVEPWVCPCPNICQIVCRPDQSLFHIIHHHCQFSTP